MPREVIHDVRLKPLLAWQRRLRDALHSPARFIVAIMGRRAGKTSACARLAGRACLEGKQVFWGAPLADTASIGYDKFRELWRPVIVRRTVNPANIETFGGGRAVFRSFDRPGAAIGRGIDLAVVDEGARVRSGLIYEDLLPTISDTAGKILVATTPRGRRSWAYDWYARAKSGDPHYAVVHGPSTENPSPEVREFVEVARANMPDALFRQEIMGEFVEGAGSVFSEIGACATLDGWLDGPKAGARYAIGCDLAKHRDFTVLYALDAKTGEVQGADRFNRISWDVAKARIAMFSKKWNGARIWIDATGLGDPIVDDLRASGVPCFPVKFTSDTKSDLVIRLMTALEKHQISYPPDPTLLGELEVFGYEELPSGRFRYSAPEGMHDDCVIALSLAVWGMGRVTPGYVAVGVGPEDGPLQDNILTAQF